MTTRKLVVSLALMAGLTPNVRKFVGLIPKFLGDAICYWRGGVVGNNATRIIASSDKRQHSITCEGEKRWIRSSFMSEATVALITLLATLQKYAVSEGKTGLTPECREYIAHLIHGLFILDSTGSDDALLHVLVHSRIRFFMDLDIHIPHDFKNREEWEPVFGYAHATKHPLLCA